MKVSAKIHQISSDYSDRVFMNIKEYPLAVGVHFSKFEKPVYVFYKGNDVMVLQFASQAYFNEWIVDNGKCWDNWVKL